MLNTAVLISGQGSNLQALIDACREPGFPARIGLVLSNKADAYGLERARAAGIPAHVIHHQDYPTREAFDRAMDAALRDAGMEFVCLAGFMRLLSPWFVQAWRDRLINIHPSLLPAFPGVDTHHRALEAGVKFHGCTVHFVREEMDVGPIIAQAPVPVLDDDTEETLAARVLVEEHRIYPQALRWAAEASLIVKGNRVLRKS